MKVPEFNPKKLSLRESFLEALNEALSEPFNENDIKKLKEKLFSHK